mmetsp:Transcript_41177/g.87180  ORF Transcript_41177/g.87180 Transcript_41177/m.87180 type:complete len:112 (-) Transcript_41177:31-366(-)
MLLVVRASPAGAREVARGLARMEARAGAGTMGPVAAATIPGVAAVTAATAKVAASLATAPIKTALNHAGAVSMGIAAGVGEVELVFVQHMVLSGGVPGSKGGVGLAPSQLS